MAGLDGSWMAEIAINGKTVPLHQNMFSEINIRSNTQYKLPSFSMNFLDHEGFILKNFDIADGVPVNITVGDGRGGGMSGEFVIMGGLPDLTKTATGVTFSLSGVLNKVNYMRKVADKHFKSTSSEAISEIAKSVGLDFEGDSTSDKQVWLPNRLPLDQYAKFLSERGWRSDTSCMLLAVNDLGKLIYKDVDTIIKGGAKGLMSNKGGFPILSARVASKSGFYNNQRGYGSTSIIEDIDGVVREINKVALTRLSSFMNMGKSIVEGLGDLGGRIDLNPINAGNVHEKYFDAIHQNRRIKSAYGEDIQTLTNTSTGFSLLDLVAFDQSGGMDFGMAKYAGDFLLTGKVITIRNGSYFEKLQLTTQGQNS